MLQISIQRILLAMCERAAETTNGYERHRILLMYHLFVSLLLREVKDGLGGAWAFVLRDIIYTLIHHINSRSVRAHTQWRLVYTLCCQYNKPDRFVFLPTTDLFSVMRFLTGASRFAATCSPLCVGQLCSSVMTPWTATCRSLWGL